MESVDEYYSSRTRLILSCALLITWEFFGKGTKPDIDFEYFNLAIAAEAIPFLLALLTLYNTYTFAFHWKLIESSKKLKLSITDYYTILLFSFITLVINFVYQIEQSTSLKFLAATTEGALTVSFFLITSIFTYLSRKYDGSNARLISPVWQFYLKLFLLFLSLIILCYEVHRYKSYYKLNRYETVYFFTFYLIALILFVWAGTPFQKKNTNS